MFKGYPPLSPCTQCAWRSTKWASFVINMKHYKWMSFFVMRQSCFNCEGHYLQINYTHFYWESDTILINDLITGKISKPSGASETNSWSNVPVEHRKYYEKNICCSTKVNIQKSVFCSLSLQKVKHFLKSVRRKQTGWRSSALFACAPSNIPAALPTPESRLKGVCVCIQECVLPLALSRMKTWRVRLHGLLWYVLWQLRGFGMSAHAQKGNAEWIKQVRAEGEVDIWGI